MSAAAQRGALAAVGRDLMAVASPRGDRRAALLRANDADAPPSLSFDELALVPPWLRGDAEARAALARRVALLALAPSLAASIDGAWLGRIAESCGEDALDWAVATGADDPAGLAPCSAETIEPLGFAILRQACPAALRRFLPAGDADSGLDAARAAALVAIAADAKR